jgi:hypothetical protein
VNRSTLLPSVVVPNCSLLSFTFRSFSKLLQSLITLSSKTPPLDGLVTFQRDL